MVDIRKMQRTQSGSFFVTLPKTWVNGHGLDQGAELSLAVDDTGGIRFIPNGIDDKYYHEFVVELEDYPKESSIERCINSSYIQGSDIIRILSKKTISLDKKRLIKNGTSNLIGTEISEEFSDRITIRILVDPVKFPLGNLIERIYSLVGSMHADAIKSFIEKDEELARDVLNREMEVDKLFFLMLRQLNLSLSGRLNLSDICDSEMKIDCVLGILLARDLSKMSHYAVGIAQHAIKLLKEDINEDVKKHLTKMSRFIRVMQEKAILAFFKNNFMRANEVLDSIDEVRNFDLETEKKVLASIKDTTTIISLISINRYLKNLANSAIAVAQDLQAKHRPKTIARIAQEESNSRVKPSLLFKELGYETEQ